MLQDCVIWWPVGLYYVEGGALCAAFEALDMNSDALLMGRYC